MVEAEVAEGETLVMPASLTSKSLLVPDLVMLPRMEELQVRHQQRVAVVVVEVLDLVVADLQRDDPAVEELEVDQDRRVVTITIIAVQVNNQQDKLQVRRNETGIIGLERMMKGGRIL